MEYLKEDRKTRKMTYKELLFKMAEKDMLTFFALTDSWESASEDHIMRLLQLLAKLSPKDQ